MLGGEFTGRFGPSGSLDARPLGLGLALGHEIQRHRGADELQGQNSRNHLFSCVLQLTLK